MSRIGPRVSSWPVALAAAAFVGSAGLLVASARLSAHGSSATRATTGHGGLFAASLATGSARLPTDAEMESAVDADPFNPDRQRPEVAYALPGSADETPEPEPVTTRDIGPSVRLVGTVAGAQGGFAVCDDGSGVPRVVRIGERIGDLTLHSVDAGVARFTKVDGTTIELTVPKPGAR